MLNKYLYNVLRTGVFDKVFERIFNNMNMYLGTKTCLLSENTNYAMKLYL